MATAAANSLAAAPAGHPKAANAANAANADSNVTDIQGARPASRKKRWLVALALLLLGSGGGAGWYLLKVQPAQSGQATQAAAKPPPAPPVFVELETFTVNLAGDRILQTGITLQVKDAKDGEQLKLYLPQVKSRMLLLLSSKAVDELQSPTGKQALATEVAGVLRQPYAKDLDPPDISGVYLTSFVIQ